jgi:hypothetical protein
MNVLDFSQYDYQSVVDTILRMGDQFNERGNRFLKGRVITKAIENVTNGRLKFIDKIGYDNVDELTKITYEIRSDFYVFNKKWELSKPVVLKNSRSDNDTGKMEKTFDYLWVVQTNPKRFAIAEFDWKTCDINQLNGKDQIKMSKDVKITKWICKDKTVIKDIQQITLNLNEFLKPLYG